MAVTSTWWGGVTWVSLRFVVPGANLRPLPFFLVYLLFWRFAFSIFLLSSRLLSFSFLLFSFFLVGWGAHTSFWHTLSERAMSCPDSGLGVLPKKTPRLVLYRGACAFFASTTFFFSLFSLLFFYLFTFFFGVVYHWKDLSGWWYMAPGREWGYSR